MANETWLHGSIGVPMPSIFRKLTPNLLVANVERSLAFYEAVLGFEHGLTVPEESPFVFASVTSGPVEIFFNDAATAIKEYPAFAAKPIGTTGTMYIEVEDRKSTRLNSSHLGISYAVF